MLDFASFQCILIVETRTRIGDVPITMPDKGYESRKKWNAANYRQLNVALSVELAEKFRVACEANGEPMRQVVVRLISEYSGNVPESHPKTRISANADYSTRSKRKTVLTTVLEQLCDLRDAEEDYKNAIPESMYNKLESAESVVEAYENAVAILEDLYSD